MTLFDIGKLSCLAALALLLAGCSDDAARQMSDLDLKRDLCIDEGNPRLPVGDLSGPLILHSRLREMVGEDASGQAFLNELGRAILAHNKTALEDGTPHVVYAVLPQRQRYRSYVAIGLSSICQADNLSKCRNRSFMTFRPIAPELMARIMFENTFNLHSDLKRCDLAKDLPR